MFQSVKLLFLYTETPLHVGSGSSLGTVDLPIQREKHTHFPMIQSSGIKGKLRDTFSSNGHSQDLIDVIFGPEGNKSSDHAGALSPSDGRLLLFPVRSLAGVFAWITCPMVINRFIRDFNLTQPSQPLTVSIPSVDNEAALIPNSNSPVTIGNSVVLEEFSFTATANQDVQTLAEWIADNALPTGDEYKFWREKLKTDLVVLSDTAFTDFCKFSTEVVSRTKLNPDTKTVDKKIGGLWTEENLPSDCLLYSPIFACNPRRQNSIPSNATNAATILTTVEQHLTNGHYRLQLGGNETVGRGIVATRFL